MEEKKPESIDYYTHEHAMVRAERHVTRWMVAFLIVFFALIGTNLGWIIYEAQYEDVVTTTYTQDVDSSDGGDAIINDGVHINGESTANSNKN